jgi:hypothetical protein
MQVRLQLKGNRFMSAFRGQSGGVIKRLIFFLAAAIAASLCTVSAQASMPMSSVGAGAAGYDWQVGTWSCTNSMAPSMLGALQSTTSTISKLKDGSFVIHTMSPNGNVTAYNTYAAKSNTWSGPFADSGGYYGSESTQGTGKTIRWTGMFYSRSGAATPIRDTYTMLSMSKQYDLSEAKVDGAWKVTAKTTCSKP